ncbi:uncharacterized protein EV422DRAFT_523906 [Fimicolochytrium jonesii]|uniref:uncharacterized protein n=1 Tax=Fimicolochytrium jonesii TaxID=1396493 RepID=UPI0022FE55EB|nr:uncharacterized protein EV422DRAFT_523906 [Fimicolochytrium jonesii]KAI8822407.1 hypothetical protein EV422DRAFT_523906 [Fimicolochytrium jonesii]
MAEADLSGKIAATHYEHLRSYLTSYLQSQRDAGNPSNQRTSAREKLLRLTKQQFSELSTDVFDEMNRRLLDSKDVPFLPLRDDFHPKRNQARQKLATLPNSRFKDLASDVFYEVERRFPQVVQDYEARYGVGPLPEQAQNNQSAISSAPLPSSSNDSFAGSAQNDPRQPFPQQQQQQQQQFGDNSYSQPYEGKSLSAPAPANGSRANNDPSAVNFASLDNLMADLGNMLTSPKQGYASGASTSSSSETERLRRENETLRQRVKELEEGLDDGQKSKDRIQDLEQKLAAQHKINDEQAERLENLESQHAKLKESFESVQDDYNNQQQIANDIRSEATNLLDEIKTLSRKNDELLAERDKDRSIIAQLKEELSRSRSGEGNVTRDNGISDLNRDSVGSEDGVIDRSRVSAYQNAVDDLLRAARSDVSTSVLVAMKSIVIACKNITEDAETFENSSSALGPADRDQLAETKNRLAGALNNLMNAAKIHATNPGSSNVGHLDNSATQLTATIVELVKQLRLKSSDNYYQDDDQDRRISRDGRSDAFEIDELKIYLEKQTDQIVQAIQSLLLAMRQSTSFGQSFSDTVTSITTIVDNLVTVSRTTLAKPAAAEFQTRGEMILQDLSNSNVKLDELGRNMLAMPQSKTLKQKLASSSYEIAKYVKELISLIE